MRGSPSTASWMIWLAVNAAPRTIIVTRSANLVSRQAFFRGAVAAADDGDVLAVIERPVAGGAEVDAGADIVASPSAPSRRYLLPVAMTTAAAQYSLPSAVVTTW